MSSVSARGTAQDGWEPDVFGLHTLPEQTHSRYSEALRHASTAGVCMFLSKTCQKVWKLPFFQVVFVGSVAYAATAIVRKVFEDYTFCQKCTYGALAITNSVYAVRPILFIISSLFLTTIPLLSMSLAIGLGVLQGLTDETNIYQYLTSLKRDL
ncbi:MAG: hypothetical protein LLF94_07230 [Chlamydiales bacterium]|nr:hypothetical protein [Chlamydiales bacterium]